MCVPMYAGPNVWVFKLHSGCPNHALTKLLHPGLQSDCSQGYIHHGHHAATCVNAEAISFQIRVCGGTGLKSETRGHSYPSAHDSKTALCVEPNNSRRVTTLLRMFMSSVALTSMSCGEKSGMVKREECREGEWGFFGDCHC